MRSGRPRSLSLSQALCLAARRSRGVGRGSEAEMRARPAEILETGRVMMGVIEDGHYMRGRRDNGEEMGRRWLDNMGYSASCILLQGPLANRPVPWVAREVLETTGYRQHSNELDDHSFFFNQPRRRDPQGMQGNWSKSLPLRSTCRRVILAPGLANLASGLGGFGTGVSSGPRAISGLQKASFLVLACLWAGQPVGKPVLVLSTSWAGLCLLTRA